MVGRSSQLRYVNIALFAAATVVVLLVVEKLFEFSGSSYSLYDTRGPGQVTLYLLVLILCAGFVRYVARASVGDYLGRYWRERGRAGRGFLTMFGSAVIASLVIYSCFALVGQLGWSETGWQTFSAGVARKTVVALLVVVVLATTEELIFRGFLMRYLRFDISAGATIAAVLVSSFIFAMVHKFTDLSAWLDPANAPLFIGLFVLGVLLCVTYLSTGSLACSIGVHSGLLGTKVFLRETNLFDMGYQTWWLGNSPDIREAPLIWLAFALMAVSIYLARDPLRRAFAIETSVAIETGGSGSA